MKTIRGLVTGLAILPLLVFFQNFTAPASGTGKSVQMIPGFNNIYSPHLEFVGGNLKMYFGGWRTAGQVNDKLYRAHCLHPHHPCAVEGSLRFAENGWKEIPSFLEAMNDPTIVNMGAHLIMYFTACPTGQNCHLNVHRHRIYYSVSWANDGMNWSTPTLLLDGAWLPSATREPNGEVVLYFNRPGQGGLARVNLGPSGIDASTRILSHWPLKTNYANLDLGYINIEVRYRPSIRLYEMVAERYGSQAIDYLVSGDGIHFTMAAERIVSPAAPLVQVRTPAMHPDTARWLYTGATADVQAMENQVFFQIWAVPGESCPVPNGTGRIQPGGTCAPVSCNPGYLMLGSECIQPYTPLAGTLRFHAQARGKYMGTAINASRFADADYKRIAYQQYNLVTPENEMKWNVLRPTRSTFDFSSANRIVDFAFRFGMKVRGHPLVWHLSNPAWLTSGKFSATDKQVILEEHISRTVRHFKNRSPGTVIAWDVVNEAFVDMTGNLRSSIWSDLGSRPDDYIRIAFRAAARADPSAVLAYNDWGLETAGPKADAVFNMVRRMRAEGIPIHAVGMQAHLSTQYAPPALEALRTQIRRYAAIGVAVHFTEVDLRTKADDGVTAQERQNLATAYRNLIQACVMETNCTMFSTWGFTEKHSWIPTQFPGFTVGLPFDANYRPTSVFHILRDAID